MMDWLAKTYVNALNVIHYMHDKYCYESIEMALHDRDVLRTHGVRHRGPVACRGQPVGHQVRPVEPVRDDAGLIVDYEVRRRVPVLRQQRRPRRRIATSLVSIHGQDPHVPDATAARCTRSRC
jgi:formate C-acetyltransferase